MLTSGITIPAGFITSVVLARFLIPEDRGLYSVATAFAALVTIMTQLGWPAATIYRLRRVGSPPSQVAGGGLLLVGVVSLLVVPVSIVLQPVVARELLDGAPPRIFYLAVAQIPFQLLFLVFAAIARGIDRFKLQNAALILQTIATAIAISATLMVFDGSVVAVLQVLLAVQVATGLGLFAAVVRHTGLSLRVPAVEIWDSLRFGVRAYVEVLATRVHERIDIFMIAYFLGDPAQVAFYTIGAGLVSQVRVVPESIGQAAFPQMAGQTNEESAEFACKVSRVSFFLVVVTAAALALVGPLLLPLIYGSEYSKSVLPFLVLLPGMVVLTVFRVLTRYFAAIDRQNPNVATQIASVAANLVLNALWIPRYGIVGAAAASLASYALQAVLITLLFQRVSGKTVVDLLVPRREDFTDQWRRLKGLLDRDRSPS